MTLSVDGWRTDMEPLYDCLRKTLHEKGHYLTTDGWRTDVEPLQECIRKKFHEAASH